MVGLNASTNSIIGAADASGIHANGKKNYRKVWITTFSTFFCLLQILQIPVLLLGLNRGFSYCSAKKKQSCI